MKLLLLSTSLTVGGAERQVLDLCQKFYEYRPDIQIILVSLTHQLEFTLPNIPNLKLVEYKTHKSSPFSLIRSFFRLRKLIAQEKPDIVHSHMVHANLCARLLRLVVTIPRLICTAHNKYEGGKLRMLAYRLTDRLADVTTNVSQEASETFVKLKAVPPQRIMTVYNGIDTQRFCRDDEIRVAMRHALAITTDTFVFLAVGRLTPAKDYPTMLKAFDIVAKTHAHVRLLIAGTGPWKAQIENSISQMACANRIQLLGLRQDIPNLINAADSFLLSSAWEGFPLVILEAMATERLVIASDAGGTREALDPHGWLVPTHSPIALAKAMSEAMMLTSAERTQRGKANRQRVKDLFSLDTISQQWLTLYQSPKPN